MSYTNDIKTTLCTRCKQYKVMTGRHQQYNAKSKNGKIICPKCKTDELIDGFINDRVRRDNDASNPLKDK